MNKLFVDYSICEIIEKIGHKKISPTEVSRVALENIKELDPKYFAWITYGDEVLFEQERNQNQIFGTNRSNLLENIPVGVKDVFNTTDFPTQMGSPLWKNFTPGNDARTVFNLKRQGAVIIGKTVTAEFAVHTLGKTLNPYDITKNPGTSSSGSAVAISLGMVPVTTGTQTAGSIVRPASFCGVYGCKPSFGTIPRTGTLKTTDSLDTIGFFTIHQKDLRRVFDSLRVHGRNYPISDAALTNPTRQIKPKGQPWRVGLIRTHTWQHAPQYAKDVLEGFFKKLSKQKGIRIVEADLPREMDQAHQIHKIIYNKSLSYYFKGEYNISDFVSPIMNNLIKSGQEIRIENYMKAIKAQNELISQMDSYFKDFDILISLSTAGEAPLRDTVELPDPALMWTLTHLPVVSVPNFCSPGGMPFGMQVVARKYNDYLLFSFLDQLQSMQIIPEKSWYFK
jgi:Asp-tRNA(Asn)/Glu-tRNA(Gln) amidotransferase A subunit family amidase